MKIMNKKVLIISSVLVFIILAGAFWYFKSNRVTKNEKTKSVENIKEEIESNKIDSWKTYSDIELGFTIKYPSSYVISEENREVSFDPSFYIKNPNVNENHGMLNIDVVDLNYVPNFLGNNDGSAKNPDEWLVIAMDNAGKNGNPSSYIKTAIDGEIAYINDTEFGGISQKEYTIFKKRGEKYDLYAFVVRNDDVGEKIISTLKFHGSEKKEL